MLLVATTAQADVVLVSRPYHWEEYWCSWTADPTTVVANCTDSDTIIIEHDPEYISASGFEPHISGDWGYTVFVNGVDSYEGDGCVFVGQTTIDGDPNGALVECP